MSQKPSKPWEHLQDQVVALKAKGWKEGRISDHLRILPIFVKRLIDRAEGREKPPKPLPLPKPPKVKKVKPKEERVNPREWLTKVPLVGKPKLKKEKVKPPKIKMTKKVKKKLAKLPGPQRLLFLVFNGNINTSTKDEYQPVKDSKYIRGYCSYCGEPIRILSIHATGPISCHKCNDYTPLHAYKRTSLLIWEHEILYNGSIHEGMDPT